MVTFDARIRAEATLERLLVSVTVFDVTDQLARGGESRVTVSALVWLQACENIF